MSFCILDSHVYFLELQIYIYLLGCLDDAEKLEFFQIWFVYLIGYFHYLIFFLNSAALYFGERHILLDAKIKSFEFWGFPLSLRS